MTVNNPYCVELSELTQQTDERALAKRVGDTGVESKSRERCRKQLNPLSGDPVGHEITLVDDDDHVLVRSVLLDVVLDVLAAGAGDISGVHNL